MNNKMKLIIVAVFVVLLGGAGYVASALEAKKVGEACELYQSSSCSGPGAACLSSPAGNYCSITCKADGECPADWNCGEISSETYSAKTGQKVASEAVRMCRKP